MQISTRTHAFLDFGTAGFALAFPRLLGASDRFTKVTTALALGKIGYALLTRHELGVVRIIPMKTHLVLDTVAGSSLCALPFLLEEDENQAVTACAVGTGLFDIAAAPLTDTRSLPFHVPSVTAGPTPALSGGARRADVLPNERQLPHANAIDSLKVSLGVFGPTVAMGPIIRRPRVMGLAETLGFATGAVKTLQALREKYGSGPLMVKLPLRHQAVLLDPTHVRRVLDESPEPFATASTEKQAALAHFEPKLSLVSHGPERKERRRLNEEVLESSSAVHHMGEALLPIVDDEAQVLLSQVQQVGELHWEAFIKAWYRVVRRVVFGNSARDDERITSMTAELRSDANWAFLKPARTEARDELHKRIRSYLERAEPGSLAAHMARQQRTEVSSPEN